jgi:nucleolin
MESTKTKHIEENIEEVNNDEVDNKTNEEATDAFTNADKCVFVSGIPYDTTEEEIKEMFGKCGVIKEIKLPKYQDSGRNIGYGHIYYKKNKGVKKALELNNTYIGKRYINVTLSKGENTNKRI